jgi:hypothetical protein
MSHFRQLADTELTMFPSGKKIILGTDLKQYYHDFYISHNGAKHLLIFLTTRTRTHQLNSFPSVTIEPGVDPWTVFYSSTPLQNTPVHSQQRQVHNFSFAGCWIIRLPKARVDGVKWVQT